MWAAFEPDGHLALLLIEREGKTLAGMLGIGFGDTFTNKLSVWSGEFGSDRPNEALQWCAIRWARSAGYRYYDFEGIALSGALALAIGDGLPDGLRDTVTSFKVGFGGVPVITPNAMYRVSNPVAAWAYGHVIQNERGRGSLEPFPTESAGACDDDLPRCRPAGRDMNRFIGARERLRPMELLGGVLRPGQGWRALDTLLPDRPWALATYGKSAFELAVIDAGLGGGRILMPAFISHDFVGVMQRHGITPVFADVDPNTVHLDPAACTPEMLSSVEAILLLHTFGLPADAAGFRAMADSHGLVLIEDCARALGGRRDGHPVGWYADYAVYSLSKVAPIVRGGLISSHAAIRHPLPAPSRCLAPAQRAHAGQGPRRWIH